VLTLTPYDFWRHTHAIHHATSGHLERRGIGDVDTLTVQEYLSLSFWGRLRYRTYRHPLVMFGIGPAYLFLLRHRLPVGLFRGGWWPWLSVMATNVAIAAIAAGLIWFIGLGPFLLVELPTILLAGSIGVWLFYVQHQFEMTFWAHEGEWTFQEAALHGSSHYDLPGILRWFTANIGVHHVHHLCSRIPYYRLPRALRDHHELGGVTRLTLLQSLRCVRLVLWDEDQRRLVSFQRVRLPERLRHCSCLWRPSCHFNRGRRSTAYHPVSQETRMHLQDAHHRVMSVAALQQQFQIAEPDETIGLGPYLSRLCEVLAASMTADNRPISLKVHAQGGTASSSQAVSIGLIVTELVINAFKHAFPTDRSGGTVRVTYDVAELNWKLTVSDNGIGRPEGRLHKSNPGLGTTIVEALAKQLDAGVEVLMDPHGTTVSITHAPIASQLPAAA
jgi:fatty acid desaturase/two-component sensor histidine kinase